MSQLNITRLTAEMDVSEFECGEPTLDAWLMNRAYRNKALGASRTYVILQENQVIGYHALAAGSLRHADLPNRFKRNQPDPLPMMLLGRLAVDRRYQGLGLAHHLFRDALARCLQIAEIGGVVAILVHAISPAARSFYFKLGFTESSTLPLTMFLLLKDARLVLP